MNYKSNNSESISLENIADQEIFCDGDWVESKDQDSNGSIRLIQLADIKEFRFYDKSEKFMNEEAKTNLMIKKRIEASQKKIIDAMTKLSQKPEALEIILSVLSKF